MTPDCAKNEFPYVSMRQIGQLPFAGPKYLGVPPLFFSSGNMFSRQYNHACKNNTGRFTSAEILVIKEDPHNGFSELLCAERIPASSYL